MNEEKEEPYKTIYRKDGSKKNGQMKKATLVGQQKIKIPKNVWHNNNCQGNYRVIQER